MIEWLPVAFLFGVAAWFWVKAAFERAASALQQIQHEQFWGDGMTADGSWAETLHGQGVSDGKSVVASNEDLQAIRGEADHPRRHALRGTPCAALTPPEDVGL
jgi:hypothetical protein